MKKNILQNKKGFTMIEMMVAISIFLVVIIYGIGSILNAYSVNKRTAKARSLLDNMSFIVEDMSRTLRTGTNYKCATDPIIPPTPHAVGSSCSSMSGSGNVIAFDDASGNPEFYSISSIPDGTNTIGILSKSLDGTVNNVVQLTPNEINIDTNTSGFFVTGAEPGNIDSLQPYVVIRLSGTITSGADIIPFSLQTSVSQRLIDVDQSSFGGAPSA